MVTFDGDKLKEKLKERNMTQRELAEKAHVTETSVSRYIIGERQPTITTFMRLIDALECDFTDLLLII